MVNIWSGRLLKLGVLLRVTVLVATLPWEPGTGVTPLSITLSWQLWTEHFLILILGSQSGWRAGHGRFLSKVSRLHAIITSITVLNRILSSSSRTTSSSQGLIGGSTTSLDAFSQGREVVVVGRG